MRILALVALMFLLIGCGSFRRMSEKCENMCKDSQEENVGARFMWNDVRFTFGKCTCVGRDGVTKVFYIRRNPSP